jgi:hypothetical protein
MSLKVFIPIDGTVPEGLKAEKYLYDSRLYQHRLNKDSYIVL